MLTFACLSVLVFGSCIADPARQDSKPKSAGPASEVKSAPTVRDIPTKDRQTKPVKVADVIKGLGLDESTMSHSDEPPGKLRAVSWSKVKLPGTEAEVDVEIHIVYTLDVFSTTGKWDIKAVHAATVTKVAIVPSGSRD